MSDLFCPQCGKAAGSEDHFCRSCGAGLAEPADLAEEGASESPQGDASRPDDDSPRSRKRIFAISGLVVLILAAVATTLVLTGVLYSDDGPTDAQLAARDERATQVKAFEWEMRLRDQFFAVQRDYLDAYTAADNQVDSYQKEYDIVKEENDQIVAEFADEFDTCYQFANVPCPDPDYPEYPDVPDVSALTDDIRLASRDFEKVSVRLLSKTPTPELTLFHQQLSEAVTTIQDEAQSSADVLDEAVVPEGGEGGGGYVQDEILRTLREDSALPIIRSLNRTAVSQIEELELDLGDFDVPGGKDIEEDDDSTKA